MKGLVLAIAIAVLLAVACTSEATPTTTPTSVPTVTPTSAPTTAPVPTPTPSGAGFLQEIRQKLQETSTLLVRMTYPTSPDQDPEEHERVRVEFTRDKYHIIGESYEGESYYYPAGGWACWLTDTGPMEGEREITQGWEVMEIPRE